MLTVPAFFRVFHSMSGKRSIILVFKILLRKLTASCLSFKCLLRLLSYVYQVILSYKTLLKKHGSSYQHLALKFRKILTKNSANLRVKIPVP